MVHIWGSQFFENHVDCRVSVLQRGAQKITNLGKLPSKQKRKTPKQQKKNKNHEGKLPSQKGEFPSLEMIKYDNIF